MALHRAQKGFRHVFIVGDEASGEYGSFSICESKVNAEAANAVIAPRLQQALRSLLRGPPERRGFEVLEPERIDT